MVKTYPKILFFLGFVFFVYSCNVTKKLGEDEFYLKSNEYEFDGEKEFKGELEDYVSQKPNSKLLGLIPSRDWAYNQVPIEYDSVFQDYYSYQVEERNQALLDSLWLRYGLEENVGESKWISRLMYRAGAKPITLDTAMSVKSATELEEFYFSRGYFDAEVNPTYEIDTANKKAQVTYNVAIKEPSDVVEYNQVITDTNLEKIYAASVEDSEVKVNERFDVRNFEDERDRLTKIFLDNGYFQFNDLGNELVFRIDSTNDKNLNATLKIAKGENDSIQHFQQYYLGDINVFINRRNSDTLKRYDTVHRGYNLFNRRKFKLNPRVYTDAIAIKSGDLYRYKDIASTRQLILDRDNYQLTSLQVEKSENPLDSLLTTTFIFRPKEKYDLELSFEGSYSQFLNFGISPGVKLLTRNVFRGGENVEFNLRGTVGTVNTNDSKNEFFNAYELSFETKMTIPRWVLPVDTEELVPKSWNPKSSISLGLSGQKNIGLGSRNYSAIFDYSWKPGMNEHLFELINFQYIKNTEKDKYYRIFSVDNEIKEEAFAAYFDYDPSVEELFLNENLRENDVEQIIYYDPNFVDNLPEGYSFEDYTDFRNVLFRKNSVTQDVVIQSFTHTYSYNENTNADIDNPWFITAKGEVAGLLLKGLDAAFNFKKEEDFFGNEISLLGGVPYSEFVRLDLDVRKKFKLSEKTEIAFRGFTGLAMPYGNLETLPFTKSYFGGGSNDVRAWQAYELSPAPLRPDDGGTYIDQMKITWNAEYRFPLVGIMNGALFVDAGNIWSLDSENTRTKFEFDKFLSQLGVGSGFGLRFDFTFVVARLDFAYKIHDPAYEKGNRWFNNIKPLQPQLQFGINYPF